MAETLIAIGRETKKALCLTVMLFLVSCARHKAEEVDAAMQYYDRLLLKMDADSIALIYSADGELGSAAKGRDSIRNFLSSFKDVKVESQESHTDSISINVDSAWQSGTYHQRARLSDKKTVEVKGKFTAKWIWNPKSGWLLKRMDTAPM